MTEDDIAVKSPGQGLSPVKMPALIGKRIARAMAADDYFFPSDLSEGGVKARSYRSAVRGACPCAITIPNDSWKSASPI